MWVLSVAPQQGGDYVPKLMCATAAAAFLAQAKIGRDMLRLGVPARVKVTKIPPAMAMQWAIDKQNRRV